MKYVELLVVLDLLSKYYPKYHSHELLVLADDIWKWINNDLPEDSSALLYLKNYFWVSSNQYQRAPSEDILQLWRLLNLRIADVLDNMPESNYKKQCNTGSLHTLEWLAADYLKHLKHHMNQIISGSFDVIYK